MGGCLVYLSGIPLPSSTRMATPYDIPYLPSVNADANEAMQEQQGTASANANSQSQLRPGETRPLKRKKACNCKRTKCLKKYCECFANGYNCTEMCGCQECCNSKQFPDLVHNKSRQLIDPKVEVTPDSTPNKVKRQKACRCKNSLCRKKYCECFQAGIGCSENCRCENCKNSYGRREDRGECSQAKPRAMNDTNRTDARPWIGIAQSNFSSTPLLELKAHVPSHTPSFQGSMENVITRRSQRASSSSHHSITNLEAGIGQRRGLLKEYMQEPNMHNANSVYHCGKNMGHLQHPGVVHFGCVGCVGCFNLKQYGDLVYNKSSQPIYPKFEVTPDNTPNKVKVKRGGCRCKSSLCQISYCECFQAGIGCSVNCRCGNCKNSYGRREGCNQSKLNVRPGVGIEQCKILSTQRLELNAHVLSHMPSLHGSMENATPSSQRTSHHRSITNLAAGTIKRRSLLREFEQETRMDLVQACSVQADDIDPQQKQLDLILSDVSDHQLMQLILNYSYEPLSGHMDTYMFPH